MPHTPSTRPSPTCLALPWSPGRAAADAAARPGDHGSTRQVGDRWVLGVCGVDVGHDPILRHRRMRCTGRGARPVSYTHLRAHETDSYLVCRLLLEKKKKKTKYK